MNCHHSILSRAVLCPAQRLSSGALGEVSEKRRMLQSILEGMTSDVGGKPGECARGKLMVFFQNKNMVRWYCQSNTNPVGESGVITEEGR